MDETTPNKTDASGQVAAAGSEPVRLSSRRRMKNSTVGSPKSALEGHSIHASIKMELSDSQDETPTSSVLAAVAVTTTKKSALPPVKKVMTAKRAIINVDAAWSSDEEDFAGFGEFNGTNDMASRRKKIKEEPLSDIESLGGRSVKIEPQVKQEQDTEEDEDLVPPIISTTPPAKRPNKIVSPVKPIQSIATQHVAAQGQPPGSNMFPSPALGTPKNTKPAPITDPRYRKPFEFGWKRELVYRAHNDVHRKQYDKGEVYYITPAGKKLRTKTEILINLTEGLDANDFTFTREALGMGPEDEIIRSAKMHSAGKNRPVNFLDLGEADPALGFGKRVPKPKVPKGASPTPMNAKNRGMLLGQKKIDVLIDTPPKAGKPKAKGEPCTIQCVPAMGTIPQLQCKKCLCLFHLECVRRPGGGPQVANYVCESCLHELNEQPPGDAIASPTSTIASTVSSVVTTPQAATTTSAATTSSVANPIASASSTTQAPKRSNNETDGNPTQPATNGGSVIGGITTWMPPSTNLTTNRSELDTNSSPPQSIAIVAGRKYIMVPKTNLMSVSPSGDVKIANNNGDPLQYADEQSTLAATKASAPTTGEDATPPAKKRLVSRSAASSKVQTPNSSPNSIRMMSPAGAKIATMPTGIEKRTVASATSVQSLYAKDLFNQLSIGYDVLLHTFQYLKVQELLRASCVCRIWNQAAHNKLLWRTVRMKNSKVNDFAGFVQALKSNGTKHLDLRKMLLPSNNDESWQQFSDTIGQVTDLESIDLCRLPGQVVEKLFLSNPGLRILNSVAIKDSQLNLIGADQLTRLRELRLKSLSSMHIDSLAPLQHLKELRHLSLTSIKELGTKDIQVLGALSQLESLELGECSELSAGFAADVLLKLNSLERLRMEKGQEQCCTFEILDAISQLPQLTQLELVNFDIKPEFDAHLKRCQNIRRLLIIPTYISQSATTNHMILNGVLQLSENLEQLTLVVTLELLRVTELYVDQCDGKRRERKQEDKIPVLKPVPGMSDQERNEHRTIADVPQVEILPLEKVEKILATHLPHTKFSIIKVPYHSTWRQTMVDLQ